MKPRECAVVLSAAKARHTHRSLGAPTQATLELIDMMQQLRSTNVGVGHTG
jgi:hypothetical protein